MNNNKSINFGELIPKKSIFNELQKWESLRYLFDINPETEDSEHVLIISTGSVLIVTITKRYS